MTEFAPILADKWNIELDLASEVCLRFEKGDSIFYLIDYHPRISTEFDVSSLGAIIDFLREVADLAPKKKRVLNALKKADALTGELENRVALSTNGAELDDILLPHRPNPRSRAQVAIRKGLGPLADAAAGQEVEDTPAEKLAAEYVGKHESLKTVDDVLAGVKDILVERFAYDETVRSMVREFGFDDGYLEVTPRNKKDREFLSYRGRMVPVGEISPEEYFKLMTAEQAKKIRLKHGVQLFRITELLRTHFVENPDSSMFDLVCEAIDECWSRFLQHVVETTIKETLRKKAEDWALQQIVKALDERMEAEGAGGATLAVGMADANDLILVAFGPGGHLLGATRERRRGSEQDIGTNRVRQFINRYRPARAVVHENAHAAEAQAIVGKAAGDAAGQLALERQTGDTATEKLAKSSWMDRECTYLDSDMRTVYAIGLARVRPLPIITHVGIEYFTIHPMQHSVDQDRLAGILQRKMTESLLHRGVSFLDLADSALANLAGVKKQSLEDIRKQGVKERYSSKNDLLRAKGITEVLFRNIAGYVYFTTSANPLDRTLVHPDHFEWVEAMAAELNVPVESLISDPEQLRSLGFDDFSEKAFVDRRLREQLRFGQQHAVPPAVRQRQRLQLSDLTEGAVMSGRVTNITQFGVFVDINAVCDGLVHISQLADGYVETAEQVVSMGDQINVRIMKVDRKKRRISLSMKGLGEKGPKVRPSRYQLSNLADHFRNR
ncbi:MAG: S1 RNA-binding domain-containing protein [Chitinivibrionales bacterium]|nr:S1 RNA-binding domain-containing protein [Chitinivibrionales bacterium]MBD3396027.1 S1 RNA-binding domain-containing protein [Chitinivibrionales bacterium]